MYHKLMVSALSALVYGTLAYLNAVLVQKRAANYLGEASELKSYAKGAICAGASVYASMLIIDNFVMVNPTLAPYVQRLMKASAKAPTPVYGGEMPSNVTLSGQTPIGRSDV